MKNILITSIFVLLIIAFALLKMVWAGFVYFAIISLIGVSIYWIVILTLDYNYEYKTTLLEKFKLYSAKLINSSNVTSLDIEENKNLYIKKFKKSLRKEKAIEWLKILFLVSLIIVSIVAMATGAIK